VHQRPELLTEKARSAHPDLLAITEEPACVLLTAWCQVADVHEVTEQAELDALAPFHVLGADYATARLKWRPKHPLVAIVARVHRVDPPIPLDMDEAMRGCRSWIEIAPDLPAAHPVLSDADFAARRRHVAEALAGARADGLPAAAPLG
jgi:hypothetical protein